MSHSNRGARFAVGDRVVHKLGSPLGVVIAVQHKPYVACPNPCQHCEERWESKRSGKLGYSYDLRVLAKGDGKSWSRVATLSEIKEEELEPVLGV